MVPVVFGTARLVVTVLLGLVPSWRSLLPSSVISPPPKQLLRVGDLHLVGHRVVALRAGGRQMVRDLRKRAKIFSHFLHVAIDHNLNGKEEIGQRGKMENVTLINFPPDNDAGVPEPKNGRHTKEIVEFVISSHSNSR